MNCCAYASSVAADALLDPESTAATVGAAARPAIAPPAAVTKPLRDKGAMRILLEGFVRPRPRIGVPRPRPDAGRDGAEELAGGAGDGGYGRAAAVRALGAERGARAGPQRP